MKGSEFFEAYRHEGLAAWEAAALALVRAGDFMHWPIVDVPLDASGAVTIGVASDYFAVGEPGDYFYLPLTPITAQKIADLLGMSLPTTKIVRDTWRAAHQIQPEPMRPAWLAKGLNPDTRMVTLDGYADHNAEVLASLSGQESLVSGTKKDVVLSNRIRKNAPGKQGSVAIYGWFDRDGAFVRKGTPIQGLNPSDHVNTYADYSHGVRFVEPFVTVDGVKKSILDPKLAPLVTDEGSIAISRYDTGAPPEMPLHASPTPPETPIAKISFHPADAPASILGNLAPSSAPSSSKKALYVTGGIVLLGLATSWFFTRK